MDTSQAELARIVETYSSMLLRVALTHVDGVAADAEDVVQDVFLQMVARRPCFRDREHEKAWLIRATLNRARDVCRKRRDDAPLDTIAEAVQAEQSTPSLLSAVCALPGKYSAVIHLYYYEGYSIQEIAKLLALPSATVGTRLARGRKRLAAILKEDDIR